MTSSGWLVGVWLGACVLLVGCGSSKPEPVPPDARFGHRYEDEGPEGRETVVVTPPEEGQSYFYYPVYIDTVHVRPAPFETGQSVQEIPVEVLIKGAFPNSCNELSGVEQERAGSIINVQLTMRKPKGAVCAGVERPFRFYLRLEGGYGPGNYTLKINDTDYAFTIRRPGG